MTTPVHRGPELAAGVSVEEPALIDEPFTVVAVAPGQSVTIGGQGNDDLRVD